MRFDDLGEFLRAHASYKRALNPRWTFGVWSRRLGLRHAATLTRVVNGTRAPGPVLSQALCRYFRFTSIEIKYWECLVLRRTAELGSHLRDLAHRELEVLRRQARKAAAK